MKSSNCSVSLLIVMLVVVFCSSGVLAGNKVVCYFTNWSFYRNGIGKYSPSDIDGKLCTHIIYSFAVVEGHKIKIFDDWLDVQSKHLEKVAAVRQTNPGVKVLLAVGGWNAGSVVFSNLAKSSSTRKIFIDSVVDVLSQYNYDGLDLDWEYPAKRGGIPADKQNFNILIKELKAEFSRQARNNGGQRMLLTAAVGPAPLTASVAYDKKTVCSELDFVNLMQYDIHGTWEGQTGHNAPLYASPQEATPQNVISATTKDWLNAGCSSDKLILGIPTYGRVWTLKTGVAGVGSPGNPGKTGPFVGESGMLSYQEICNGISKGWRSSYDDIAEQAMAFGDNQWVSYDNTRSIAAKVNFIKSMRLGGAMIWALDFDDFNGQACGQGKYPLLTAINNNLRGLTRPPPRPATRAPTTEAPATRAPATRAPATRAPATRAPATRAPATRAPATRAPATRAPATRPPATRAPATRAPATRAPATRPPATRAPKTRTTTPPSGSCRYRPKCNLFRNNFWVPDKCNRHKFYTCTSWGALHHRSCGRTLVYNHRCECCTLH